MVDDIGHLFVVVALIPEWLLWVLAALLSISVVLNICHIWLSIKLKYLEKQKHTGRI